MNLDKRTKIFLGCAVGGMLAVLALPSRMQESTPAAPTSVGSSAPVPQIGADTTTVEAAMDPWIGQAAVQEQRERAGLLTWGRNPFRGPRVEPVPDAELPEILKVPPPSRPVLRLTGISISGHGRFAVIEQEVVQVGDILPGGYAVREIVVGEVRLVRGDEELVLRLEER